MEIAETLKKKGTFETKLQDSQEINVDLTSNLTRDKCVFKQMTWIPNEIPVSNLVLFTMIDRCENHLSNLKVYFKLN